MFVTVGGGSARVGDEQREYRVIEPAAVASLRLARDSFELEAQPADDRKRSVVVGGCRHAHPMCVHRTEGPIEDRLARFGHEAAAARVQAEPIPELDALVQMAERLEADDAEELPARTIANGEPTGTRGIPIGRARLGVATA